ncbi:FadR/GntR family transcriptional regulator [uncultured Cohaesibacter sp.]|uniref:FadR/GntR family transcriptional regulator n=1 Tax=uncultured Cohaesibacter sp. TaxID=1002546 RepID=UPI002930DBA7|nr:FadR/GntR family transcriptional regulator [uncultured Cohaesibacter sp.]
MSNASHNQMGLRKAIMAKIPVVPARKQKLSDTIYAQILSQITTGEYSAGDKLPSESELSSAFHVSRPIVREALSRLSTDGLIYSKRGLGSFVALKPSKRLTDFANVFDLSRFIRSFEPRMVLEIEATRLAATRRSRAQVEEIADAVDALDNAIAKGELGQDEDIAFHDAIARASGNDFFVQLLTDLRLPVQETMHIGLELAREGAPARRIRIIEEHSRIRDAIDTKDSDAAAGYMKYHLLQARAAILDAQHLETSFSVDKKDQD